MAGKEVEFSGLMIDSETLAIRDRNLPAEESYLRTLVDYLLWEDGNEPSEWRRNRLANTVGGLAEFSKGVLGREEVEMIAPFLSPNSHVVSHAVVQDHTFMYEVLSEALGPVFSPDIYEGYEEVEDRAVILDRLAKYTVAHMALLNVCHPITILLEDDFAQIELAIDYGTARWEGLGALGIYLRDGEDDIPWFVVRGNPCLNERNGFKWNSMQRWISESITIVDLYDPEPRPELQHVSAKKKEEIELVVREGDRIGNRLVNYFNRGEPGGNKGLKLSREDIVVLLGLTYLQAVGLSKHEGINPAMFSHYAKLTSIYEDTFSRWFQRDSENALYPWQLDTSHAVCFLPNYNRLPGNARAALARTFQDVSKVGL